MQRRRPTNSPAHRTCASRSTACGSLAGPQTAPRKIPEGPSPQGRCCWPEIRLISREKNPDPGRSVSLANRGRPLSPTARGCGKGAVTRGDHRKGWIGRQSGCEERQGSQQEAGVWALPRGARDTPGWALDKSHSDVCRPRAATAVRTRREPAWALPSLLGTGRHPLRCSPSAKLSGGAVSTRVQGIWLAPCPTWCPEYKEARGRG